MKKLGSISLVAFALLVLGTAAVSFRAAGLLLAGFGGAVVGAVLVAVARRLLR